MKTSVEKLEPTKVKMTVTVDTEELDPYLDETRKELGKQVAIPGFRKGHVPARIIDQRLGFPSVVSEALNNAVPELYSKGAEQENLRPMDQPKLDVTQIPTSADDKTLLEFTAEVEVRPEFELPDPKDMEIEVAKPEVKDEDVDRRLDALRQRFGTLVGVDRPAQKGDFVSLDLNAVIDGETVDSQSGVSYEIGSGTMLDGLDEALDGLSKGEETTFEAPLASGDHEGEKAQITVTVNSVKAEELPELNDDFAQEASEFDTLDELKADIRKQSETDSEGRQANDARDAFIARLEEGLDVPVPTGVKEALVADHVKALTPDPDKASDEDKKKAEDEAIKEITDQMVLDALSEKLQINVTQNDVTNFLASIAQQYGMDPSQFISSIVNNGQLGSAVKEVGRSKGLLAGMRLVTFKDTDGKVLDLSRFLGEEDEPEQTETEAAAAAAASVADKITSDSADEK
ncbi:MAG: trigger factor [Bifidobacteriaceae bacterium]|nr:trigger factor [Bifidobacteriaceae bacterium]